MTDGWAERGRVRDGGSQLNRISYETPGPLSLGFSSLWAVTWCGWTLTKRLNALLRLIHFRFLCLSHCIRWDHGLRKWWGGGGASSKLSLFTWILSNFSKWGDNVLHDGMCNVTRCQKSKIYVFFRMNSSLSARRLYFTHNHHPPHFVAGGGATRQDCPIQSLAVKHAIYVGPTALQTHLFSVKTMILPVTCIIEEWTITRRPYHY